MSKWSWQLLIVALVVASPHVALAKTKWKPIAPGIAYRKITTASQKIVVTRVALHDRHVGFRVNRAKDAGLTTAEFGNKYDVKVAINGDFFAYTSPPKPSGMAIANGQLWHEDTDQSFIAIGPDNFVEYDGPGVTHLSAKKVPAIYRQALGGRPLLLWNGKDVAPASCPGGLCSERHPRTATGLSKDEKLLYLVVVDGRRPGAAGMTLPELAAFMKGLGAHWALNHDGGGSSAMWIDGSGIVNVPSDGSLRRPANHLGVVSHQPFCKGGLEARVETTSGKAIAGALVDVDGGRWKKKTDAKGEVSIKGVECGAPPVVVSADGYASSKKTIFIDPAVWSHAKVKLKAAKPPMSNDDDESTRNVDEDQDAGEEIDPTLPDDPELTPGANEDPGSLDTAASCNVSAGATHAHAVWLFIAAAAATTIVRRRGAHVRPLRPLRRAPHREPRTNSPG
jgi:exopolysaccharide biosynthesis protein